MDSSTTDHEKLPALNCPAQSYTVVGTKLLGVFAARWAAISSQLRCLFNQSDAFQVLCAFCFPPCNPPDEVLPGWFDCRGSPFDAKWAELSKELRTDRSSSSTAQIAAEIIETWKDYASRWIQYSKQTSQRVTKACDQKLQYVEQVLDEVRPYMMSMTTPNHSVWKSNDSRGSVLGFCVGLRIDMPPHVPLGSQEQKAHEHKL
eukprot:5910697-Amphidinium_carterae.2